MKQRLEFEPFGECVMPPAAERHGRASGWLLRVGQVAFWSLAAAIVLARALCFDPGVLTRF